MDIRRVAVVGAGVMGSGIAAHFANAGVDVDLLDALPGAAAKALERLRKAEPAPFMHPSFARRVRPGDLPTDLARLAEADWIVEAVVEKPAVKAAVYAAIDAVRKPGSIVSSNTSTIPLARLLDGQSPEFAADFLIAHFFNPPRYMRLLELVAGPATRPEITAAITDFADRRLGKGVVPAHDTPGFIANRIGSFWLQTALNAAQDLGLSVEEADAVCGAPMGFPKTGVFGLMDLVGLDLVPQVVASLQAALPTHDPFALAAREQPLLQRLVAEGFTGRKGRGGFYRTEGKGPARQRLALDLASGDWRPRSKPHLESLSAAKAAGKNGLAALLTHPDRGGRYARAVLLPTLAYAASLVPEIADSVDAVDQALRLGYNWRWGPFELMDRLGSSRVAEALTAAALPVPPLLALAVAAGGFYRSTGPALEQLSPTGTWTPVVRPQGVLLLSDIKRAGPPVKRNGSAALWDVGDGVLCLEFTTRMNALDPGVFALVRESIGLIGGSHTPWKALVIHNDGENFSVGANLGMAMFLVNTALWAPVEALVEEGQRTYHALRRAPFPVVAAPSGMALGGGCEFLLHCDAVEAHAETYIGLVEAGVGLLPAWGGSTELLHRLSQAAGKPGGLPGGPMPPVARAFETIALAKVGKSAAEARDLGYLRPGDGIVMNRDRILAAAKARALALVAAGYHPPPPAPPLALPGPAGRVALELMVSGLQRQGKATPHDGVVSAAIARVLTGGDTDPTATVDDEALLLLERQEFMALIRTPGSIKRIEHMLTTGKPLRN